MAERDAVPTMKRALPPPSLSGSVSLEEAIAHRRSFRDFDDTTLTDAEIGQLLWAAQGVTDAEGHRAAPSDHAAYPIELYVAVPDGVLHYLPAEHAVEAAGYAGDLRMDLMHAALGQPSVVMAGAVFVFSVVARRSEDASASRAQRYMDFEVGHAAQNLLLQATALGLHATSVGNVDDISVHHIMGIGAHHEHGLPVYLVAVGGPRVRRSS